MKRRLENNRTPDFMNLLILFYKSFNCYTQKIKFSNIFGGFKPIFIFYLFLLDSASF